MRQRVSGFRALTGAQKGPPHTLAGFPPKPGEPRGAGRRCTRAGPVSRAAADAGPQKARRVRPQAGEDAFPRPRAPSARSPGAGGRTGAPGMTQEALEEVHPDGGSPAARRSALQLSPPATGEALFAAEAEHPVRLPEQSRVGGAVVRRVQSAAAATSRQSFPALCDPMDGSPPGSPVPRILQARTLEWVAISFSNACMHAKPLQSCPTLCDLMDGSPPGSSVPGILQARTLEWAAIPFSNACMHAKPLQSCPALCDPMDGSPPGSPVHGILQARSLEWVAITFSTAQSGAGGGGGGSINTLRRVCAQKEEGSFLASDAFRLLP